jgi:DNA-binding NarL/FixJ family response regulator
VYNILIADDSDLIRGFLKSLAAQYKGWTIVGEAVNGRQAVLMAASLKPDLVVVDLAMPMLDGLRAAVEILKGSPAMPIILYTLHDMPHLYLEAKKAGIREVVFKTADATALAEAIQRVFDAPVATGAAGEVVAPPLFVDGGSADGNAAPVVSETEEASTSTSASAESVMENSAAAAAPPEEPTGAN